MPTATENWRDWGVEDKRALLKRLRERKHGTWRDHAHPPQLPPDGPWLTIFFRGGRGSGKSWAGANILRELIEADPGGTWAVIAPTFGEARDKCIESEESGLLAAFDTSKSEVEAGISPTVANWNRSMGEMYLHDGTKIKIDGADDGATSIQGENLKGAWCDEVGLWKKWHLAWDESLGYATRKGESKIIATGTPKRNMAARALVKRLLNDPNVVSRRLRTQDNFDNLSPAFQARVLADAGTELGRQELEGELLEESEGALWSRDSIDAGRITRDTVRQLPGEGYWRTKVLALDPSDGNETSDEQAWCLAGVDLDRHLYVMESEGMRTTPDNWLKAAVRTAREHDALILIEKNHGGKFIPALLEQIMAAMGVRVPYKLVDASEGKRTRAERPAQLYAQGLTTDDPVIHHVGYFPDLEDQMLNFLGIQGEKSPDRLDALVWAVLELMDLTRAGSTEEVTVARYSDQTNGAVASWR